MIRREARLRREYLYRKALEGSAAATYEKKRRLRDALDAGRPVPTELRAAEPALALQLARDDQRHAAPRAHADDEYARAAEADPRVIVTTSRDPSARLAQFAKELRLLLPDSQRLNRGGLVVADLVAACRANEFTDIVIAHEHRGEPDGLIVCHLPYGPTAFFNLSNVVMRHDIRDAALGTVSEAQPHLIFHGFHSALGQRVADVLKYIFPVPKDDSKRVMTFVNNADRISFRHHVYTNPGRNKNDIALHEVGPRFEMQLYQLRLGTIDQNEADDEWVLRSYMNSAKRRKALG
jgi:U3 small nucleolar ribonucleoprotein protein IMP4